MGDLGASARTACEALHGMSRAQVGHAGAEHRSEVEAVREELEAERQASLAAAELREEQARVCSALMRAATQRAHAEARATEPPLLSQARNEVELQRGEARLQHEYERNAHADAQNAKAREALDALEETLKRRAESELGERASAAEQAERARVQAELTAASAQIAELDRRLAESESARRAMAVDADAALAERCEALEAELAEALSRKGAPASTGPRAYKAPAGLQGRESRVQGPAPRLQSRGKQRPDAN